ncbi:MAG TPA: HEAT repeat domain-containing protein [Candidatus Eisenbacteria bacterium]
MIRRILFALLLTGALTTSASAWLPDNPLADPTFEEILQLENDRATSGRIVELTKDNNPLVRARAFRALARAQDPATLALFTAGLADTDPAVRDEAAFGMGLLWADGREQDLVEAYARETDPRVKATLIEALGRTTDGGAGMTLLASTVTSADTTLSYRACLAVGVAGYRKVDITATVDSLGRAARSPHAGTRWASAYALFRGKPEASVQILRPLLADRDPLVRMNAVRALSASKRNNLALPISELVRDADWRVRLEAIKGLATLKATQFANLMSLGLDDEVPVVRSGTFQALGELRSQVVLDRITPLVTESDDWRIRTQALYTKTQIEVDGTLPLLEQLKTNNDWHIRRSAAQSMGLLASDQARAILGTMVSDSDPRVLAAVAEALTNYPQVAALEDLRHLLTSEDLAVLTTSASALGARGDRGALGGLNAAYARLKSPADSEPMTEIVKALGNIVVPLDSTVVYGSLDKSDRDATIATLTAAMKDPDRNVALAAAASLGRIDGKDHAGEVAPASSGSYPLNLDVIRKTEASRARIVTGKGEIVIEFLPGAAPNTVANFVTLVSRGYFNGLTFHRVVPGFVTQDGCPRGDGWGGPGYAIRCEYNDLHYEAGMVGMALSGKDTGGSQYFITQTPQPHLDGKYTIFGRVISGLSVLEEILVGEPITRVDLIPS